MEAQDFIDRGSALYGGHGWKTRLAADLDLSRKTIHSYVNGQAIPRTVVLALDALQAARVREISGSSSVASADPTSARNAGAGQPLPVPAPKADLQ